eukprot:5582720-Karenia_brevis.AAC.1
MERINIRVNEAYPEEYFGSESGAVPDTFGSQSMLAKDSELHLLRNKHMFDGKQSAGHDALASDVNN